MKPSLQRRFHLGLALSLIVVFVIQWAVVINTVHSLTESYVASRLGHDADTLLGALDIGAANLQLSHNHIDTIYSEPYSGHYFVIKVRDKYLRSRSLWDSDFPAYPFSTEIGYASGPLDQWLLVKTNTYKKQGQDVVIAVAEDLSATEQALDKFNILYALISGLALSLLLFLQAYLVKRSFMSLDMIRVEIQRLEKGEISQLGDNVPVEIYPLIKEFNRLLTMVSQRLQRSRNALGNLAHALKTPLTVLIRLADQPEIKKYPALHNQLEENTEAIQRLMARELKSARLAGAAVPGMQFNCNEEIPRLVDTLQRIHQDRRLTIHYTIGEGLIYPGDREDMIELFGNLLDNACKWAVSRVEAHLYGEVGLAFTIEDDGPGSPHDQLARLAERGVRLDESVSGHGLGLSIAKEIVRQYNGTIDFTRSAALGGFKVAVQLPGYRGSD